MARKKDPNVSAGQKLLKMYHILLSENKPHYQSDLVKALNCSPQTVIRLAFEIEQANPECFQTGTEKNRRWYRLQARHKNTLGLDYQELQYLSICQELSKPFLPEEVIKRIDKILLQFSMLLLESDSAKCSPMSKSIVFLSKGQIDYTEKLDLIENILNCIEKQFFCHIHYIASDSKEGKSYYFVPQKLIAMNNALYVYGAITNNIATELVHTICLAIHRIKKLDLIKQTTSISISSLNINTFGLPWHEPRTFSIKFTKDAANYVKERIWCHGQKIEQIDNGEIILTVTTSSEPELKAWVRSFGKKATIITN
ncbi:hypothetical protein A9G41_10365 [Gilliamella sp. Nev5-1]|jgi:hypothetical protein|uniref:WYL domain-containing protein n=1 Tax=unclassified Gilliamella TaxID=2685620 RepID=UPI00080E9CEE|nr:WYL domain-containing protein [Gilliamella apicola]OCG58805.1 hypothetical protein A9G40_08370 [Gilliamella apicola]OCG67468.1 hypothetical protein A9G41_10365 [Gilliamella apicola]